LLAALKVAVVEKTSYEKVVKKVAENLSVNSQLSSLLPLTFLFPQQA
jgi:hypothetical protein